MSPSRSQRTAHGGLTENTSNFLLDWRRLPGRYWLKMKTRSTFDTHGDSIQLFYCLFPYGAGSYAVLRGFYQCLRLDLDTSIKSIDFPIYIYIYFSLTRGSRVLNCVDDWLFI